VEHNNFCVSAHFRNCAGEHWQRVVAAVNDSVAAQPAQLHVTRGRKVLEVRPQVRPCGCVRLRVRACTVFLGAQELGRVCMHACARCALVLV
jgi:hypothetical protein